IERDGQKQVVAVIDHQQLTDGALLSRVVDEVFLGAVRADVPLQRELARDDVFDRDFLVPAIAAIALVAARLGDIFRAADPAAHTFGGLTGHVSRLYVSLKIYLSAGA